MNLQEGLGGLPSLADTKKLLVFSEYVFRRGPKSNELPPIPASEEITPSASLSSIN